MSATAIRIENFSKLYPMPRQKQKRVAVDDLTLDVPAGSLFGFLGPNGAGKTTTIKMLLGFLPPTSGGAWLFGLPVEDHRARQRVGYLPEQPYFPKFLSAQEIVSAHAGLAGLSGRAAKEQVRASLEKVGMDENRFLRLSQCSKGMTQRVALAAALVGKPDLLILDEPSSGLDPVGRKDLRRLLQELKSEGKTIFLSSHLLSEMEPVCDRVSILARGKLVAAGSPEEVTRTRDEITVQFEPSGESTLLETEVTGWGGRLEPLGEAGCARLLVPSGLVYRALNFLEQKRAKLIAVSPARETLEDAFLRLVGTP